jgi:hypothetical protein
MNSYHSTNPARFIAAITGHESVALHGDFTADFRYAFLSGTKAQKETWQEGEIKDLNSAFYKEILKPITDKYFLRALESFRSRYAAACSDEGVSPLVFADDVYPSGILDDGSFSVADVKAATIYNRMKVGLII